MCSIQERTREREEWSGLSDPMVIDYSTRNKREWAVWRTACGAARVGKRDKGAGAR